MEGEIDLRAYIEVLFRWWWLIVSCTLLAATGAFVASSWMDPVYRASVTLLVQQAPAANTTDYTAMLISERLARTYTHMLSGRAVLEPVIARLGLQDAPDGLESRIEVELVGNTQLIRLSIEDTDPAQAALIANTIAEVFAIQNQSLQEKRYVDSLSSMQEQMVKLSMLIEETGAEMEAPGAAHQGEAEFAHLQNILAGYRNSYTALLQSYEEMRVTASLSVNNVIVVEQAEAPEGPVRPSKLNNTVLAATVGAMLAVGIVFLLEYLDDTIKVPGDVERAASLPTLGAIVRIDGSQSDKMPIAAQSPRAPVVEAYRALRTNLQFATMGSAVRTLMLTSPQPIEGKTTTLANLAVVMAQSGLNTIAVDTDLRRSMLHRKFGLVSAGLTLALLEMGTHPNRARSPLSFAQDTGVENLRIIASGTSPPNPADLLGSGQMKQLIQSLREEADVILFDTPPTLAVTDAAVLATQVDGIVLVVNAGKTRCTMLKRAVEELQRSGTPVLGVVINRMTARTGGSYYHDYYRRYYAPDDGESDDTGPDEPRQTIIGRIRLVGRLAARYWDNHRTDSEEFAAATEPHPRPRRIRRPHFPDPFERDPE
jgi:non-specific protein-tyrosine kinase